MCIEMMAKTNAFTIGLSMQLIAVFFSHTQYANERVSETGSIVNVFT